jgi:Asp-tRNA(Asn)/Glu-tRNA(Gln) amidotransferase A subunit family amidase
MTKLLHRTAEAIAWTDRERLVSAIEVLNLDLERIATLNPRVNAIVTLRTAGSANRGATDRRPPCSLYV